MDQTTKEKVQELITVFGVDKVRAAVNDLLESRYGIVEVVVHAKEAVAALTPLVERLERATYKPKGVPAEFFPVIQPDALRKTLEQIDAVAGEVIATGKARENAYGNKAELVRATTNLETAIKLAEAEAFMQVSGNKVTVNGIEIALSNDTNRDAYRRQASKAERQQMAQHSGDIAALDVDYRKADDAFKAAVAAQELVSAKAHVQAALLNFLATRQ